MTQDDHRKARRTNACTRAAQRSLVDSFGLAALPGDAGRSATCNNTTGATMDDFTQKLVLNVVDKVVVGIPILLVGVWITKAIERFKNEQAILKEYQTLRDRTALQHLQRQIEELYSPLLGMVQYSQYVFSIFDQKKQHVTGNKRVELQRYFDEKYFLPLNAKMAELIRSKIYLIETDDLPDSFQHLLQHEAQFSCQHFLWKEANISSDEIRGLGWPMKLEQDVETCLSDLRRLYNAHLNRIKGESQLDIVGPAAKLAVAPDAAHSMSNVLSGDVAPRR